MPLRPFLPSAPPGSHDRRQSYLSQGNSIQDRQEGDRQEHERSLTGSNDGGREGARPPPLSRAYEALCVGQACPSSRLPSLTSLPSAGPSLRTDERLDRKERYDACMLRAKQAVTSEMQSFWRRKAKATHHAKAAEKEQERVRRARVAGGWEEDKGEGSSGGKDAAVNRSQGLPKLARSRSLALHARRSFQALTPEYLPTISRSRE